MLSSDPGTKTKKAFSTSYTVVRKLCRRKRAEHWARKTRDEMKRQAEEKFTTVAEEAEAKSEVRAVYFKMRKNELRNPCKGTFGFSDMSKNR